MTDAGQLAGTDPAPLFARVVADMTERKARLLRVALGRALWDEFTHPELRHSIAVAERYADGECGEEEYGEQVRRTYQTLNYPPEERPAPFVHLQLAINSLAGACLLLGRCGGKLPHEVGAPGGGNWHVAMGYAPAAAVAAMRDLFGDVGEFAPRWRTETVVALAEGIYHDRAFDRLPILADALEEAGCDRVEVLNHCREDGFHARGCWVVDGLLGKG